ncbi:Transmembrane_domain-containing protein [Hexamita inflata]|uniref:Transmembrane domain-containing protein n=1 Tax=Hexamita inflata TaxID=28002 RepID=A0AA86RED3_9EUKA|nr:Transmembrane domain-containing protein [Hexamita inflata]CAI9975010.1 Transmembrane domain-containing protein [Hexamita inflata]CAI9976065.1 Transmembrane domain-containing protein [Hexamita inflata]
MPIEVVNGAHWSHLNMNDRKFPTPIFDIDMELEHVALISLAATLFCISIFVAKDVKKQKVLSFLLSVILSGLIAVSGTIFIVSVLLLADMIM